jgi:hypothetical protein
MTSCTPTRARRRAKEPQRQRETERERGKGDVSGTVAISPFLKFTKLLPNLYKNFEISQNKSCSKFKMLQLFFWAQPQIPSIFEIKVYTIVN